MSTFNRVTQAVGHELGALVESVWFSVSQPVSMEWFEHGLDGYNTIL